MSSSLLLERVGVLVLLALPIIAHALGCYESIISFGDSLADTGNYVQLFSSDDPPPHAGLLPYGETYFRRPTGRFSDGRLVIDFIAQSQGLPLVPPYNGLENGRRLQSFRKGVNFAVGGATALGASFFEERGIGKSVNNFSLRVQLDLFKELLPSLCNTSSSSDCREFLRNSLVLMGEIGGNDYNNPFFNGRDLQEIQEFVPYVIDEIASAVNELIDLGAATIMVPGNLPIGCLPVYLTSFQSSDGEEYDSLTGCLNWLNEFSEYHNVQLQKRLDHIRVIHPNVQIIYADYYNAAIQFYQFPENFGFDKGSVLNACCGGGGTYNVNSSASCGSSNARACEDPSLYPNWDGIHLTEAAYRWIFKSLAEGPFTVPKLDFVCSSLALNGRTPSNVV